MNIVLCSGLDVFVSEFFLLRFEFRNGCLSGNFSTLILPFLYFPLIRQLTFAWDS